jgi:hypothetical protein
LDIAPNPLTELQRVIHAARRIGSDDFFACGMMAPCAAEDHFCQCTRLAKLALGSTMNITKEFDTLPEGMQF